MNLLILTSAAGRLEHFADRDRRTIQTVIECFVETKLRVVVLLEVLSV